MSPSKSNNTAFALLLMLLVFAFLFVNPFSRALFFHMGGGQSVINLSHLILGLGLPHNGGIFPFFPSAVLLIFWLIVTIWVYNDAEKRNMSGILWGLLVFVGNIIGLIIYLIVRSGTAMPVAPVAILQKKCPSCSQPVREDFKLCPHCGTSLRKECSNCKKNVESDWKVCPYCGTNLQ